MGKWVKTAQAYDQGVVLRVKLNTDIKYAQATGTYKGSSIMFEDKNGEARTINMKQDWLEREQQADIKGMFASLKMDDKFTVWKTREVDEIKVAGKTLEEIRDEKVGYYGIKGIYNDWIIPEGMSVPCYGYDKPGASAPPVGGKRDLTGMKVGGCTNAAYDLLPADKVTNPATVVACSKKLYELIQKLITVQKSETKMNDFDAGQAVGAAVGNACKIVNSFGEVEAAALVQLREVNPEVTDFIKADTKPAAKKAAAPKAEAKPAEKAPEEKPPIPEELPSDADDLEDDVPF